MYDVIIIGGGIVGCAAAYYLGQYDVKTVLLEKENDVADGTTKANSAIIHAGYDPQPDTLMAKYNVPGAALAKELCEKLDVPYRQCGALVAAFGEEEKPQIRRLYQRGMANGVPGLRILEKAELHQLEPNLAEAAVQALWVPTSAIVSPWEYALALAETAVRNGVVLNLNSEVTAITRQADGFTVATTSHTVRGRYIINAAGVNADKVHELIGKKEFTIQPVKGEYYLLDKSEGDRVAHTIFQCPTAAGKGVLVSPTVHGNLIVGPNAAQCGPDDTATTALGQDEVRSAALKSVPNINFRENIRNFAGVRARSDRGDFIVEESRSVPDFFNLAGIMSPGLSAAPALALAAVDWLKGKGLLKEKKQHYIDSRKRIRFKELSDEQKNQLIEKEPAYGRIICRCETIPEGEILAALHGVIPAVSIDAVKRRCNAGMGRCQGGFCGERVADLLMREHHRSGLEVLQDKAGSQILVAQPKGRR
jgi:glycerol-3-phosphate dehydrogenase